MKKFAKLVALLLALVTLVSTAVACNSEPQPTPSGTTNSAIADTTLPTDTTGSGNVTPPKPVFVTPETVTIKQEGNTLNYVITRPEGTADALSGEINAAQQLSAYFEEKIGATPTTDTDWAQEEDSEKLEIIVGATDHPETQVLISEIPSYGDYAIRAIGNKIIIVSFDDGGYTKALRHIKTVLSKGYDESAKTITVNTSDFAKTENVNKQLSALPIYEGGQYYATYDAGLVTAATECDEIIVNSTTAADFDKYLEKLEAKGYTEYTTNEISNNKFAIYTNDEYTLNVGYYDYDKSARLLVEPKGALPTRAEDNNTEKVTTAQITMIAVSSGNSVNGLSTLIRLEDGRFIVVDGAWTQNYAHLEKTMIEQSKDYSNGKPPVIAAWIITHQHGDHLGLLVGSYGNIKNSGITVESIIINQVSEKFVPQVGYGNGNTEKIIGQVAPALGADVYKAHIGQTFYLSNLRMDVVYTQEGAAPNGPNSCNAESIVTKMTFTDSETGKVTTYLSTGDATGIAMQNATNIFGDYMKSDILSLPHHGGNPNGENSQLAAAYKFVMPQLILCPVGDRDLGAPAGRDYNKVILESDEFKQIFYAGDRGGRDVLVPLPYIPVAGHVQTVPH